MSEPPATIVVPEYVFAADRVTLPLPITVSPPGPAIGPASVTL